MNKFKASFTFTSPQSGKTYFKGDIITQREFDELPYSDTKHFSIIPASAIEERIYASNPFMPQNYLQNINYIH
jgi:hypothetical protein